MISFVSWGSTGCMIRLLKWVENLLNWQAGTLIIKCLTSAWQKITRWISQGSVSGHTLLSIFLSTLDNKANCKCAESANENKIVKKGQRLPFQLKKKKKKKFTWRVIQVSSAQRGCELHGGFQEQMKKSQSWPQLVLATVLNLKAEAGLDGFQRFLPTHVCVILWRYNAGT